MKKRYILWWNEIGMQDVNLVGGKNASLGELYHNLTKEKIPVPNGFAITALAYQTLLQKSGTLAKLRSLLQELNPSCPKSLSSIGKKARNLILTSSLPQDLVDEILTAYRQLSSHYKTKNLSVAVRSSATAEDLPSASFAGQQETFLHITGESELLLACSRCFASLFTDRAIAYRAKHGIDHLEVSLSIGVQKMIRSDLASAGVLFTLDTETGFSDVIFLSANYGLGESVVQGAVDPDEFYLFKPTLKKGYKALIQKKLGEKASQVVYAQRGKHPVKTIPTPFKDRTAFCLEEKDALQLAKWALTIEEHYSRRYGKWTPMDIEWAKDGKTGKLYIVQARPETVQSRKDPSILKTFHLEKPGKLLLTGRSVGNKIGQGPVRIMKSPKDRETFQPGEILVTDLTDPDWVPLMRIASAIITNRGGRTSHAAIVSRELGLPCLVAAHGATTTLKTGQKITVDCSRGEVGSVYEGILPFTVEEVDVKKLPSLKTKTLLNVGCPDEALRLSFLPNDGVGLAREEFIISERIGIHPLALIHFSSLPEGKTKKQIEKKTSGYKDKKAFFIEELAMGIGQIAAAFFPKEVILRFSDFKTNEYRNLIGGCYFEPQEENPMIGWRGASRYYSDLYKEAFFLECEAVKKVRNEWGLTNLKVMIPVCRTPEEGQKVLDTMQAQGLVRGKDHLEVYVMCEVPSNVLLAEAFCKIFDGFSIGSNDLTQLILGVDRDSSLVAPLFCENNEAVKQMIQRMISVAKKYHRKVGICGDAPSTYPDFACFLVDCGIDSISLSPDAVLKTRQVLADHEARLRKKR